MQSPVMDNYLRSVMQTTNTPTMPSTLLLLAVDDIFYRCLHSRYQSTVCCIHHRVNQLRKCTQQEATVINYLCHYIMNVISTIHGERANFELCDVHSSNACQAEYSRLIAHFYLLSASDCHIESQQSTLHNNS